MKKYNLEVRTMDYFNTGGVILRSEFDRIRYGFLELNEIGSNSYGSKYLGYGGVYKNMSLYLNKKRDEIRLFVEYTFNNSNDIYLKEIKKEAINTDIDLSIELNRVLKKWNEIKIIEISSKYYFIID